MKLLSTAFFSRNRFKLVAGDLAKTPVCFTLPDGTVGVLVGEEGRKEPEQKAPDDLPPYTPYVSLPNGKQRILAPALTVIPNEDRLLLMPSNMGSSSDVTFLVRFEQALERFHREQRGYVQFGEDSVLLNPDSEGHGVVGLDAAMAEGNVLTLLEYRPGMGQKLLAGRLVGGLEKLLSEVAVWRVLDNHPGSSGTVFGRCLLRMAETALSLPEGQMEEKGTSITQAVSTAGQLLGDAKKTVGMVIMDADRGTEKAPNELASVIDVCKAASTSHSGFRLVLLSIPTFGGRLPHDGPILSAPIPEAGQMDFHELETKLQNWHGVNGNVGMLMLKWLCERSSDTPLLLSDIVDEIVGPKDDSLFPPSVEHALWASAPFIDRNIADKGKILLQPAGGYGGSYHNSLKEILSEL